MHKKLNKSILIITALLSLSACGKRAPMDMQDLTPPIKKTCLDTAKNASECEK